MCGQKFSNPLTRQMHCGEDKGEAWGVAPMQRSAHTSLIHLTPFSLLLHFLQSRKAPLDGVPAWMFRMQWQQTLLRRHMYKNITQQVSKKSILLEYNEQFSQEKQYSSDGRGLGEELFVAENGVQSLISQANLTCYNKTKVGSFYAPLFSQVLTYQQDSSLNVWRYLGS